MYRKALINGEYLYFVYGPPQTDLDPDNHALPKPPYIGARREFSSVYYYWWAFLRLNESYIDCCASGGRGPLGALYEDFRDVRGEDFITWWKQSGAHCFAEPQQSQVAKVLNVVPVGHNFKTHSLISVPLAADIEQTLSMLRFQLKPLFAKYRTEEGHFSKARYKVSSKPVLSSLHKILQAKSAKIAYPTKSAVEVVHIAGLNIERDEANQRLHGFLKKADQLIANVVEGRFPDFSDPERPKRTKKYI